VEDFTWAELATLRTRQRMPARDARWNGRLGLARFEDVLALVRKQNRTVGVYAETKDAAHFRAIGLPLEERLARALRESGVPYFVQSFEPDSLRRLAALGVGPRVQRVAAITRGCRCRIYPFMRMRSAWTSGSSPRR